MLLDRASLGPRISFALPNGHIDLSTAPALLACHRTLPWGPYIGGTGLGTLGGRVIVSLMAEWLGWRMGLLVLGVISLGAASIFWFKLPRSRHFKPYPFRIHALFHSATTHLRDPVLLALFAEGFLLLGAFMAFFNYLGYRLMEPPLRLQPGCGGTHLFAFAARHSQLGLHGGFGEPNGACAEP